MTQRIFFAPFTSGSSVLIVDPATNATTFVPTGASSGDTWAGGVCIGAAYAPTNDSSIGAVFFGAYGITLPLAVYPTLNQTRWAQLTLSPTDVPSSAPVAVPTSTPTPAPSTHPTVSPVAMPTSTPTITPTSVCAVDAPSNNCDYSAQCVITTVTATNTYGFICQCRGGFTEIPGNATHCKLTSVSSGSSSSTSTINVVAITVSGMFVVLFLWYRRRRVNQESAFIPHANDPTDFETVGSRIFTEFGIGSHFDVQPNELGFVLTLGTSNPHVPKWSLDSAMLNHGVAPALLACLASTTTATHTFADEHLDWTTATVKLSSRERLEVSVIVKRSPGANVSGNDDDRIFNRVMCKVAAGEITFRTSDGDRVTVLSAALMVPTRIPRYAMYPHPSPASASLNSIAPRVKYSSIWV